MMDNHSWGWGMGGNPWIIPVAVILIVAAVVIAVYLLKDKHKN
jgi:hypothetical protein